jgi:hypothetical protein
MMETDKQHITQTVGNSFAETVLLAAAVEVTCVECRSVEMAVPLDREDEPLSEEFLAGYVCSDCEEPEPAEPQKA